MPEKEKSKKVNPVFKQMYDEAKKKRIAMEERRKNELPLVLTEAQRTKLIEENKSATQEGKDDCENCTRLQEEAKKAKEAEAEAKTGGMRIRKKRKSSSKKRKSSSKKRKASSKKRKASSKKR